MTRQTNDNAASVKARLIAIAKRDHAETQSVLIRYGVERVLYRLGRSAHCEKYLLKGATLFALWFDEPHRPTKDVDLLGFGDSDIPTLEERFREICLIEGGDGLMFDPTTVRGEQIREEAAYRGVRIKLTATLGTAKIPVQIDVGFGDAVTPAAKTETLPTMLDLAAPVLRVYPKETVVAEKFEALVRFGIANSRMKDLWDLDYLVRKFDFDGGLLQSAIRATFESRQTKLPEQLPVALSDKFALDGRVRTMWDGFINRNSIKTSTDLEKVVAQLRLFFYPIITNAATGLPLSSKWHAGKQWEI